MKRRSGILLSITSLPSPYGIGTIGKEAREFADYLKEAGQSLWQILPLGPTSIGDSPYQSFSSFAGNPYLVDLDTLCEEGLLTQEEIDSYDWYEDESRVDYGKLFLGRFPILRTAFERFKERDQSEVEAFVRDNSFWIQDYALFMALKYRFDLQSWVTWPEDIRTRQPEALERYRNECREEMDYWIFIQFKFYEQWKAVRGYVNSLGIRIIGDIPIYVAMDSSDVWASPKQFLLTEEGQPSAVAGCPPDLFSATGQLWGNPLYDWDAMKQDGYRWWVERMKASAALYDIIRIDHFRGFASFYSIPYPAENAIHGEWIKGPGYEFFETIREKLGDIDIIAEDLGAEFTEDVPLLVAKTGFPGMKILQFAFDGKPDNDMLPENLTSTNCAMYTGTHDNDTVMGWKENAPPEEVARAEAYCQLGEGESLSWGFIRKVLESIADTAIVPVQDLLELGNEARMNYPSTLGKNWTWRVDKSLLTPALAARLRELTVRANRLPQ